jgi:hypothetical protein
VDTSKRQADKSFPAASPDVFYDLVVQQNGLIHDFVDAIDAKFGVIFGASMTLAGILAAIVGIAGVHMGNDVRQLVRVSLVAWVVLVVESLVVLIPWGWHTGPKIDEVSRDYSKLSPAEVRWKITATLASGLVTNRRHHKWKKKAIYAAAILLTVQTGSLVLALLKAGQFL